LLNESLSASDNDEFWKELISQAQAGRFKHFKSIPDPACDNYLNYANAAVALSKTLDFLFIDYLRIKHYGGGSSSVSLNQEILQQHEIFTKHLKSFENLKEVSINEKMVLEVVSHAMIISLMTVLHL
jgi:hypothetical protein